MTLETLARNSLQSASSVLLREYGRVVSTTCVRCTVASYAPAQIAYIATVDKTKERALQRALLKQHWGALLLAAPARIGLSVCLFAQPFIVYHAVDMVDRTDATYADKNSLVFATALVYGGIGVSRASTSRL